MSVLFGRKTEPDPETWDEFWSACGTSCPSRTCPLQDHPQEGKVMPETKKNTRLAWLRVLLVVLLPLVAALFCNAKYGQPAGWAAFFIVGAVVGYLASLGNGKAAGK